MSRPSPKKRAEQSRSKPAGASRRRVVANEWLRGGGEMGERTRAFAWSKTALGPIDGWPQSLKTAVSIMLGCRYPLLIWWGPDLLHFYNDAYVPVLGKRHPSALGKPAPQVWSEAWPLVGPQADAVMREGKSHWNEELLIVMTRNGYPEEVYMTFSYGPIMDDTGKVGGVFCACTEETPRVLSRRRLATLRALADRSYQAKSAEEACAIAAAELANNPNDLAFTALYLLNPDGSLARRAGYSGPEAAGRANPEIIDTRAPDAVWPFREVIATTAALELDHVLEKFGPISSDPWPESVTRALVLPMIKPGQHQVAGFFVAGISPRLPFDESYRSFLGLVAAQAATAVANAQAYDEERRRSESLAELDRAKTEFFSNVSHEFRTPLTLMLGPLNEVLALDGELSPRVQESVTIAQRNALRLTKLVNTLLDFSRIEAGRIQASYEPVDLPQLTADLASSFRAAIERAGMHLQIDCAPLSEPIWVDVEMWEKVVLNLLSNAFKFTFDGEISVRVSLVPGDTKHVQLEVSDTGTGIADADLPHIFERFHRVRGARARSHEGSGIGLSLVQELVRLHGGTVTLSSAPGKGTTFRVRIPTGSVHLPQDRIAAPREQASTATGVSAFSEEALRWLPDDAPAKTRQAEDDTPDPRRLILLADDNADMREYITRLLASRYDVEAVADGQSALRVTQERRPDLVLTDIMMPGLDGLALLRALRRDPQTRETPVILLSARAGEESTVEGLNAGADDYLVKPFTARELLARVDGSIGLGQERRRSMDALSAGLAEQKKVNAEIRAARRATLNVLEDAVEARNRAEHLYDKLRERERWLRGQRDSLTAAVNDEPLSRSLGALVSTATEALGESSRAAFYLADDLGTSLHHVVGMPADYAQAVDGFQIGPESLACGLATHTGEPVLTSDVQTDARWEPWRWLAERYDYRGCWSFPIHSAAGKFVGTLAMYSQAPRAASERELELASLLTHTASIIISRHTEAEARKQVQRALLEREQR